MLTHRLTSDFHIDIIPTNDDLKLYYWANVELSFKGLSLPLARRIYVLKCLDV